jgi:hypothetical protein
MQPYGLGVKEGTSIKLDLAGGVVNIVGLAGCAGKQECSVCVRGDVGGENAADGLEMLSSTRYVFKLTRSEGHNT